MGTRLTLINVLGEGKDKVSEPIITAVLNLHTDNIIRMIRQPDNFPLVFLKDGGIYKLAVDFKTFSEFIRGTVALDDTFEDDVMSYYNDNYK